MELYFSSALEVSLICVRSTEQLYYHIVIIYHIYLNIVPLFYLANIVCHFTDIYVAANITLITVIQVCCEPGSMHCSSMFSSSW